MSDVVKQYVNLFDIDDNLMLQNIMIILVQR